MRKSILLAAALTMSGTAYAQAQAPASAPAGAVAEQSNEYRFQLDLHVNDTALAKLLPTGWGNRAAATQGAAKDCNLRLIFIDRVNITGPDNRVLGKGKDVAAYLEAPVRQTGAATTGRIILTGLSENDIATAGTFDALVKASRVTTARAIANADGTTQVSEDWNLTGTDGSHLQLHVKYAREPANRAASDVRFFNPANPSQSALAHTEQETDITRNVTTTPPDRVKEFSFKVSGGKLAALFDGTEKPLSWDSQPTYRRAILGQ